MYEYIHLYQHMLFWKFITLRAPADAIFVRAGLMPGCFAVLCLDFLFKCIFFEGLSPLVTGLIRLSPLAL